MNVVPGNAAYLYLEEIVCNIHVSYNFDMIVSTLETCAMSAYQCELVGVSLHVPSLV